MKRFRRHSNCQTLTGLSCLLITSAALSASAFWACAQKPVAPPPDFFHANSIGRSLLISPGDVLNIRSYYEPELNRTVRVRPDGRASLAFFQGLSVAGQTAEALQDQLVALYSKEFTHPEITVDIDSTRSHSVYVTGQVLLPGEKDLSGTMTLAMLLAMAQVDQKSAGIKTVLLIRGTQPDKYNVYKLNASFTGGTARDLMLQAGDVVYVPRKGIVKADDFMEQYVRQLLPATPSLSTSVLFTPGTPLAAAVATH